MAMTAINGEMYVAIPATNKLSFHPLKPDFVKTWVQKGNGEILPVFIGIKLVEPVQCNALYDEIIFWIFRWSDVGRKGDWLAHDNVASTVQAPES